MAGNADQGRAGGMGMGRWPNELFVQGSVRPPFQFVELVNESAT